MTRIQYLLLSGLLILSSSVWACDFCSIYMANQTLERTNLKFDVGVSETFSRFTTLKQDGQTVPNPQNQYLNNSITQVFINYSPISHLGIQLNLPFISRSFQRPTSAGPSTTETEFGIGDASLTGNLLLVQTQSLSSYFNLHVMGGIKFPTGSTDRLDEELNENENGPASGIHGHDVTLGSGSVDGLLGIATSSGWKRILMTSNIQYSIRSRGAIDYRFANDLQWNVSPGYYVLLNHFHSLALQARLSGDYKKTDDLAGTTADDTGITSLFIGPNVMFTQNTNMNINAGFDFPILIHNTALQSVPDYRAHATFVWQF